MNLISLHTDDYINQIKDKMKKVLSPITKSENVKKLDFFRKSISSESKLVEKSISNYICLETGLIFNQLGARGEESDYYEEEYDLHSENDFSEFKYLTKNGYIGIYDNILNFIDDNLIKDKIKGKILDVGCGKGLLLRNFFERHNGWELYGIEPSRNAINFHKTILPNANIHQGGFETSPFKENDYDLVVSNGVLEHVADPLKFLAFLSKNLNDDGLCFIGVPNFCNNAVDIYTYDHLSKFTPTTIRYLFDLAELEIVDEMVFDDRVPMWFIVRKKRSCNNTSFEIDLDAELQIYNANAKANKKSMDAIEKCFKEAEDNSIVIYGTGSIFLLTTIFKEINLDYVKCFVDDNDTIIGTNKMGIPIKSPEYIRKNNINNLVISSNPCYHQQIIKKINSFVKRAVKITF